MPGPLSTFARVSSILEQQSAKRAVGEPSTRMRPRQLAITQAGGNLLAGAHVQLL
jgi:hypothetical protein